MNNSRLAKIRSLLSMLPEPQAVYRAQGAVFEMYRAKDLGTPYFRDPVLKNLVVLARRAYGVYGTRASLDQYDRKAAIYLVRVLYPVSKRDSARVEEWLSIRMVPGTGDPVGGGELEIFSYKGEKLDRVFASRLAREEGNRDFWKQIVSSSRMCGIHPYFTVPKRSRRLSIKHRFTAIGFPLIHIQFTLDYSPRNPSYSYRYVTAIIRSELAMKGLKIERGGKVFRPLFTPAFELLGVDREKIAADRSIYAYDFPAYWFDVPRLISLLRELIERGALTNKSVAHYTGGEIGSSKSTRHLGSLLTISGSILGSGITGEELRQTIDARLGTIPELKITEYHVWNRALRAMLQAAGIAM